MTPPSTRPRLHAIDPDALAISVAHAVSDHVWMLRTTLLRSPGDDLAGTASGALTASEVARSVRCLARYAQDGTLPADGAPVAEHLITLVPLWSSVLGGAISADDGPIGDPETEMGCVLRAVYAREQVEQGVESLAPAQLAVLAGLGEQQVRHLIRGGELAATETGRTWEIAPAVAREWLAARGVPGFAGRVKARRGGGRG